MVIRYQKSLFHLNRRGDLRLLIPRSPRSSRTKSSRSTKKGQRRCCPSLLLLVNDHDPDDRGSGPFFFLQHSQSQTIILYPSSQDPHYHYALPHITYLLALSFIVFFLYQFIKDGCATRIRDRFSFKYGPGCFFTFLIACVFLSLLAFAVLLKI